MYHRFHGNAKRSSSTTSGKWRRMPHTGLGGIRQEQIGDWQLEVAHRRIGLTIRRDQYSVTIRRESPAHEEFLTGFSRKSAAIAAARRRIEQLEMLERPLIPRALVFARRKLQRESD